VILLFRKALTLFTAFSMLACSAWCACPAEARPLDEGSAATQLHHSEGQEQGHNSTASGHCQGSESDSSSKHSDGQPCHDEKAQDCAHCQQLGVKAEEGPQLKFVAPQIAINFFATVPSVMTPLVAISERATLASGLPPPREWTTLLRMHCALIV
jgi:hypothetical protein